jgi:peroxiredoxin
MSQLKFVLIFCLVSGVLPGAGAQAPAGEIPDLSFFAGGKVPFTNKDLARDKPLFFLFVDPGCEHCQRAMRTIGEHFAAFRNAAVYVVSLETLEKLSVFVDQYGPALKGRKNVVLLQDSQNQFIVRFKPRRYPAMMLYSARGKLIGYEDNAESVFRFFKLLGAPGK